MGSATAIKMAPNPADAVLELQDVPAHPETRATAEEAGQINLVTPVITVLASTDASDEQQPEAVGLSPISTPTSMLLPVQLVPVGGSPERVKYINQIAAYDSELSEDASLLLDASAAYVSRQPSDTEGILDDTLSAEAAAQVAAAGAVEEADSASATAAVQITTANPEAADSSASAADGSSSQAVSKTNSSISRRRSRVSREPSQHDVSQQTPQQRLQPQEGKQQLGAFAGTAAETTAVAVTSPQGLAFGSEPPSLADFKSSSTANSSLQTAATITPAGQPVHTIQQLPPPPQQQQQSGESAAATPVAGAVAAYTTTTVAATPAATPNPNPLGSDSGLRNALAKLKPVRTTAENVAAAAGPAVASPTGNAGAHRKFKAGAAAAAELGAPDMPNTSGVSGDPAAASAAAAGAVDETVMTPMYYKSSSNNLLSLTIQRSTPLKPDLLVTNPVVRLHVVNAATGEYVRMIHQTAHLQEQQQVQVVSAAGAAAGGVASSSGSAAGGTMRHIVERPLQDKMLESLGRPALSTVDNNTAHPRPALLEYIPPIQTRPFDMLEGSVISSSSSCTDCTATGLVAEWNEELCVDLSVEQLKESDALLLLEVIQLPSGFARFQHHVQRFDLAGRSHPVAWAFLRLQGLQAQQQQLAQGKPLQLQLYQYKPAALAAVHALSKGFSGPHPATAAKAAYLSWNMSGFKGSTVGNLSSPRSPLKVALGGIWGSRDGATSPSAAGASTAAGILQQQQQRPGSPGGFVAAGSRQGSEAEKYPGLLQVVLAAKPRPVPEMMVVITDPAAGIRPDVPAGYGTGFEHGRIPFCLLHKPRALGAAGGRSFKNSQAGAAESGSVLMDQQLMLLESKLHRPHTQPCQVPNAVLVDIKGSAGGCSCIASSRDGRWLVAACADAAGRFKINLYQALTGCFLWMLGIHEGMVYSINWAKDDSAIITTSADYTAKVWHLPILPTPGNPNAALGILEFSSMAGTGLGTAAAAEAAAEAGVACTVLQHKCFVYAGELHPVRQPWLLAVTGAYDGVVRVWGAEEGTVLYKLQVSSFPINCLAFNQLGSRMYTGDAAGTIQELSVDVSPLAASAAAAAFGAALPSLSTAAAVDVFDGGVGDGGSDELSLNGGVAGNPKTPKSGQRQGLKGLAAAEAVSPVAAVLRHGSTASQLAAGHDVLKVLRTSHELAGSPIVTIACHPGGHQLVVLTKSRGTASKSKGVSDLVVIDVKLLLVARRLGGVKCCSAPLKFGVSPDGEHILCGSEDGSATIWHIETATPTPLPHMTLGGAPVYCMTWNNCFQAVATCSFSPYAPIRVLCFTPDEPCVRLNPPNRAAIKKQKSLKAPELMGGAAAGLSHYMLPDHLTPHHVHSLLADIRASAAQRGIYKQPTDPDGQLLVVKTAGGLNYHHHHQAEHRHQHSNGPQPADQQQASGARQVQLADSSSLQSPKSQRMIKAAGRLNLLVDSSEAGNSSNLGLDPEAAAAAAGDGKNNEKAMGGRNRENRRSRVSVGAGDAAAGAAGGYASQPCTPKVVLNRKGAALGGVAAPWLQQQ